MITIGKLKIYPMSLTEERHSVELTTPTFSSDRPEIESVLYHEELLKFIINNFHNIKLAGKYPEKTTITLMSNYWVAKMEVVSKKMQT